MSARILSHHEVAEVMTRLGFRKSDGEDWYIKWRGVVRNARTRDIECTLTFAQYMRLVSRAMLVRPSQIGMAVDQFNLARKGDVGGYVYGNCRFITSRQNRRERVTNGCFANMALAKIGCTKHNSDWAAKIADSKARNFTVKSPKGKIIKGRNLRAFCEEHGLNRGNMHAVCSGQKESAKGWTGSYTD